MGLRRNSTENHQPRTSAEDVDVHHAAARTFPFHTGQVEDEYREEGNDSLEFAGETSVVGRDSDSVTVVYRGDDDEGQTVTAPDVAENQRFPFVDEDDERAQRDHDGNESDSEAEAKDKPVTWSSLPKKGQLAILTFARLSEPLTQTSLQSYIFYQLKSFGPSLPDSTISWQAGVLQGSFTAAQFLTAVWWGRLADMECVGRKKVLLVGLLGSCMSCLGFGFSRSFVSAVVFRTLGGALNSNVGVMRTMIAEIIEEKK